LSGVRAKITKRLVDATTAGEAETWVWDTALKGFFLRVYPSGRKVYGLKCRVDGRQRMHTIGTHGSPWTPDEARIAADNVLRQAKRGEDPNEAKRIAREALTVGELIDAYLEQGRLDKPAKRESTWAVDASNLNRHIRPLLGRKIANKLTKTEAIRALTDIELGKTAADIKTGKRGRARVTGGTGTARRTGITVAAMFAWGIEHSHLQRADNPFSKRGLGMSPSRERFLSEDEAARFFEAISKLQGNGELSDAFADALRLLLLTGARKTEVLGLRWSEWSHNRSMLILPPARTKAGGRTGERRIPLSPPATEILQRRLADARTKLAEAKGGPSPLRTSQMRPFVFPATRGNGHAIGLRRPFVRVCEEAGLDSFRIHDLRHSFASFAIADGASLFLTGKLLGHASARTTERYAHLANDPLQDAVTRIGNRFSQTVQGEDDTVESNS
jgi:integrase